MAKINIANGKAGGFFIGNLAYDDLPIIGAIYCWYIDLEVAIASILDRRASIELRPIFYA